MRVDDLRPLGLFEGLTDEQLHELLDGSTEVAIEPGVDVFREGERADRWWVLVDGALDLVRHVGREDTIVGRMDQPGRWAGGFRAWDENGVYLATGRGVREGRLLSVPSALLRERMTSWFPMGVHLIQGLYGTARSIESTARQRESLVTLGTLAAGLAHELNNPAAAASRSVDGLDHACRMLLESLGRLAERDVTNEQFLRLEGLRREIVPTDRPPGSAGRCGPRGGDRRLARRPRRGARLGPGGDLRRGRRRPRLVRAGGRGARGPVPAARPGVGGRDALGVHACWPRCARPPDGSRSSWVRCGPTPRWTAPRCSRSTSSRAWRARS